MITKIQYTDSVSRQSILDANTDKYLIEDAIIGSTTKENFLIFSDAKPIDQEITDLKLSNETLKQKLYDAEQVSADTSQSFQELLELLIEKEVI